MCVVFLGCLARCYVEKKSLAVGKQEQSRLQAPGGWGLAGMEMPAEPRFLNNKREGFKRLLATRTSRFLSV